jgi:hypothetical protein
VDHLPESGFDLADQVGTDVRTLGEDATAQTGEDRDQRAAEGQANQRFDAVLKVNRAALEEGV